MAPNFVQKNQCVADFHCLPGYEIGKATEYDSWD
jgi:hypothetical protein